MVFFVRRSLPAWVRLSSDWHTGLLAPGGVSIYYEAHEDGKGQSNCAPAAGSCPSSRGPSELYQRPGGRLSLTPGTSSAARTRSRPRPRRRRGASGPDYPRKRGRQSGRPRRAHWASPAAPPLDTMLSFIILAESINDISRKDTTK